MKGEQLDIFDSAIERECSSKRSFASVTEAEQEARIIFNEGGPDLRVYPCQWCGGAHLTRRRSPHD